MGRMKMNYNNMTDEEILLLFKENYLKIQPNDSMEYFEKSNNIPSPYILKKRLNLSYGQALVKAGIRNTPRKHFVNNKTIELILKRMNDLEIILGKTPTKNEFRKKYKYEISNLLNKLGLSYEQFLAKYGFYNYDRYANDFYNKNAKWNKKSEEEIIEAYKKLSNKLGRPATSYDLNNNDNIFSCSFIFRRYGSLNNFKIKCGFASDSLIRIGKIQVKKDLKKIYKKYNRRLTTSELINEYNNNNIVSITTILNRFNDKNFNYIWNEIEEKSHE